MIHSLHSLLYSRRIIITKTSTQHPTIRITHYITLHNTLYYHHFLFICVKSSVFCFLHCMKIRNMTEFCYQSTTKTKNITKLTMILSLILSNPLYFLYLIFFSPYIFKLLSFLSPLFLTTSLIFFSLITTLFPVYSKDTFFLTVYNTLLHFQDGMSLPAITLEELEVYKILFESPTINENPIHNEAIQECPIDEKVEVTSSDGNSNGKCESLTMEEHEKVCTIPKEVKVEEKQEVVIKEESILKRWESNVIEGYKTTNYIPRKIDRYVEGKMHIASPVLLENCKIVSKKPSAREEVEEEAEKVVVKEVIKRWESNVIEGYSSPKKGANFGEAYSPSFGSSMRKEKEWRRTLACKLFEERHNTNIKNNKDNNMSVNEEGMDLLWETYEVESNKGKSKERESKKGRKKDSNRFDESLEMQNMKIYDDSNKGRKKDTRIEELMNMKNGDDHEDEDDVDDNVNGKLCCLQALKLSAGKMNLSMGATFSKAFKRIGLIQSHVRKQGKKGRK